MASNYEALERLASTAERLKGMIDKADISLGREPQPWIVPTSDVQDDPTSDPLYPIDMKAKELTKIIEVISLGVSRIPSKTPNLDGQDPSTSISTASNPNS